MADRAYPAPLAERMASLTEDRSDVQAHPGFERVELSLHTMATLGFADAEGLWLCVHAQEPGVGRVHPGRFGRPYRWVASTSAPSDVLGAWIDRAVAHAGAGLPLTALGPARKLYLRLMHAEPAALVELERILEDDEARAALPHLFGDRNWRPHMVACAAACVLREERDLDAAWMALDRYSWAAPQIAVTLRRLDPGFEAAAVARLEAAAEGDEVCSKPLDRWVLDRKSRGALAAMCGRPVGRSGDEGAMIARRWDSRLGP